MTSSISGQFFQIGVGSLVTDGKSDFHVTHLITVDSVLAKELGSGEVKRLHVEALRLKNVGSTPVSERKDVLDLEAYPDADWADAQRKLEAIKPLLENPLRTKADAAGAAAAAGVHPGTLYRWFKTYVESGHVSALVSEKRGRKQGVKLLEAEVEMVIESVVEESFLREQRLTPADVIDLVHERCKKAKLPLPHGNTIRARLAQIPSAVRMRRRGKKEEADNRFSPILGSIPDATHPLAIVQIDHTPLDIIVVDEFHRLPLGRPYLTLATDVFSRMVVGVYISLDSPSSASVALCIAQAMTPKRDYLASLGVNGSWPVWGLISTIHVDNAKEFRGRALERGCEQHGINLQWRPPGDPKKGGNVERLIGTLLRKLVHKLPGTTFSNPKERKGYDSDKHSALTLKELEVEIVSFIVNRYHLSDHSSLSMPPLRKWELGINGDDHAPGTGLLPLPGDAERLTLDFMPVFERTVQRYGIQLDKITYYDPILDPYIGSTDSDERSKRKFIVRRDPRDISRIYFYDPADNSYTVLPYRNIGYPAMSLFELNAIRDRLAEQGRLDIDEALIFEELSRSRERIQDATTKTKKARRALARSHESARPPQAASRDRTDESAKTPQVSDAGVAAKAAAANRSTFQQGEDDDIWSTPVTPFERLVTRRG